MYVYILKSLAFQDRIYIGLAEDVDERLKEHNMGKSYHIRKYKPWIVQVKIWFGDKNKAAKFDWYLKTGSGYAFRTKHF